MCNNQPYLLSQALPGYASAVSFRQQTDVQIQSNIQLEKYNRQVLQKTHTLLAQMLTKAGSALQSWTPFDTTSLVPLYSFVS